MSQSRFAYQSSHRRPGRAFSSPKRPKRKNQKQTIDPSRFIKAAQPELASDYEATNEFADFAMHPLLKANVTAKGYIVPSMIQDQTISLGLEGRNVVGIANTGTGKTAAFALPILRYQTLNAGHGSSLARLAASKTTCSSGRLTLAAATW
jgi:superfamily II DNA/RNA helicase